MRLRRRELLAASACACLPSIVRAEGRSTNGAFGLICWRAGISGLLLEGENGAVLDPAFRWHIGSNTKAMTAAVYARLVEQQRCRWNAIIPVLFPSLSVHPAWGTLTVEDLLSHAAGLTDSFIDGDWLDARRADPASPRDQRRALVQRILSAPPPETHGVYRYGNLNYVLVGAAMEEATDTSWEKIMRSELFEPLRIEEVRFGAPPRNGPWGRIISDGAMTSIDPAGVADNPAILWPSGGVHIAPASYAQFMSIFLRTGSPLVRPDTLAHLLTPAQPGLGYAGGWSLEGTTISPADTLGHNGSNSFWFATAIIERHAGRGYAAVTNCGGDRGEVTTTRLIEALRARTPAT